MYKQVNKKKGVLMRTSLRYIFLILLVVSVSGVTGLEHELFGERGSLKVSSAGMFPSQNCLAGCECDGMCCVPDGEECIECGYCGVCCGVTK